MDVKLSNGETANHLIEWINAEREYTDSNQQPLYSLTSVWSSETIPKILANICADCSVAEDSELSHPELFLPQISQYMEKQLGKRMRISLRNKMIIHPTSFEALKTGVELVLYLCLHSDQKNRMEFIGRILKLPQTTQKNIMASVQKINDQLDNIIELKQMLARITELQTQNQSIKKELQGLRIHEEGYKLYIAELQNENKQIDEEIRELKKEKEKALEQLGLSSMGDYLGICRKIQSQNILMADYINQLERRNNTLDQSYKDLQKSFGDRSVVIAELSDQVTRVREKYNWLRQLREGNDPVLDIDANQSFPFTNYQYNSNEQNNQSLLDISDINNKREYKIPNFNEWCIDDPQTNKENTTQKPSISNIEEFKDENSQLRKHNTDLMQRLEGTYKALQSLSSQNTQLREDHQKTEKQNKMYKKQLKLLKQLNHEFQRKFALGEF